MNPQEHTKDNKPKATDPVISFFRIRFRDQGQEFTASTEALAQEATEPEPEEVRREVVEADVMMMAPSFPTMARPLGSS